MTRVIFSIGAPGAGKTTMMRKLADDIAATYVSPDAIRQELYGTEDDHEDDKEVWRIARERMAESLRMSRPVVFDSTHTRADRRRVFIEEARAMGATSIEGVYFDLPVEEILKRNSGRGKKVDEDYIRLSVERLRENPPTMSEGYDRLLASNLIL